MPANREGFLRLFIAVDLPEKEKRALSEMQALLKRKSFKISLTKYENLHCTLAFLGDTSLSKTEELISELEKKYYKLYLQDFYLKFKSCRSCF